MKVDRRATVGPAKQPIAAIAAILGLGSVALSGCGPVSDDPRATWSAAASPSAPLSPSPSPPATSGSAVAVGGQYTFPVTGNASYAHTHHDYPASDIMAACGLPVRAVFSGVILEVSKADRYNPQHPVDADKGGISVSMLGDDGVRYYGSHLSTIASGVAEGVRVAAGAQLGEVGSTGNAGACHLHFGISPPCQRTGDWWIRRGTIWPWPYLDAWRAGQPRSPAAEVTAWQRDNSCPAPLPPDGRMSPPA